MSNNLAGETYRVWIFVWVVRDPIQTLTKCNQSIQARIKATTVVTAVAAIIRKTLIRTSLHHRKKSRKGAPDVPMLSST